MKTLRWLAASTIALAAVPLAAASMGTFSPQRLSEIDKTISSDAFEGRGTGDARRDQDRQLHHRPVQAGRARARRRPRQRQAQLVPGVPLLQSEIAGTPQLTLEPPATASRFRSRRATEIAVRAPMNGADSVDIANAPLVFVGYGVNAPERNWDDFKGLDVHGKLLVVLVNDPDFEAAPASRSRQVRRQGDDLLRPLDLQI